MLGRSAPYLNEGWPQAGVVQPFRQQTMLRSQTFSRHEPTKLILFASQPPRLLKSDFLCVGSTPRIRRQAFGELGLTPAFRFGKPCREEIIVCPVAL
jgi:hypothetical protein